jgi:hypothetical protein
VNNILTGVNYYCTPPIEILKSLGITGNFWKLTKENTDEHRNEY